MFENSNQLPVILYLLVPDQFVYLPLQTFIVRLNVLHQGLHLIASYLAVPFALPYLVEFALEMLELVDCLGLKGLEPLLKINDSLVGR